MECPAENVWGMMFPLKTQITDEGNVFHLENNMQYYAALSERGEYSSPQFHFSLF